MEKKIEKGSRIFPEGSEKISIEIYDIEKSNDYSIGKMEGGFDFTTNQEEKEDLIIIRVPKGWEGILVTEVHRGKTYTTRYRK